MAPADTAHLDHYHRRLALLADRVRSVARRFQTGAYLVGRPGSGKTHTVTQVLDEEEVSHVLLNGRVTPAALFDALEERPDSVVVIDDVPALFANPQGSQLLMAATGGHPGRPRRVTYVTKGRSRRADFRGGVVAISNLPLRHDPAGQALRSRLAALEHEPPDDELIAFMRAEAGRGVRGVPAAEAAEVCEHVVEVCKRADYRIDLRYFYKGIDDYRYCQAGGCGTDWRSLVESSIVRVEAAGLPAAPTTRAGTKAAEYDLVRGLHASGMDTDGQIADWEKRTGKSKDSYYRRKRELNLK